MKSINEVFQPWIDKYGIEEMRTLIQDIQDAGYCFVEINALNSSIAWCQNLIEFAYKQVDAEERRLKIVTSLKENVEEISGTIKEIVEANNRVGKALDYKVEVNNRNVKYINVATLRPWWDLRWLYD